MYKLIFPLFFLIVSSYELRAEESFSINFSGGLKKTILNGSSKTVSEGAAINYDPALAFDISIDKKIFQSSSFVYRLEAIKYSMPGSLNYSGVESSPFILNHSLMYQYNLANQIYFGVGGRVDKNLLFKMSGVKADFSTGNINYAFIDLSMRGRTFISDFVIGYQYNFGISNTFSSSYSNLSASMEKVYINLDLMRNGLLGASFSYSFFSAEDTYTYNRIDKSTLLYIKVGW